MGSIDVTHVAWARAPFSHALSYTGKEGYPSLAYEVIVDHSGRILAATKEYPGAHTDKSIVRLDEAVNRVRREVQYKSVECNIFKADGASRKVQGLHLRLHLRLRLICDGGYHEKMPCDGSGPLYSAPSRGRRTLRRIGSTEHWRAFRRMWMWSVALVLWYSEGALPFLQATG